MKNGIPTREEVISLLIKYHTPFRYWNGKSEKSLSDLVRSVHSGEIALEPVDDGLILHVNVVVVTVRYLLDNYWLELREDRQEFSDGTVKRRKFSGSLGEKIHKGETLRAATKRGLLEELHFPKNAKYRLTTGELEVTKRKPSDWWPGLTDIYHRHHFLCIIPPELYKPEYNFLLHPHHLFDRFNFF